MVKLFLLLLVCQISLANWGPSEPVKLLENSKFSYVSLVSTASLKVLAIDSNLKISFDEVKQRLQFPLEDFGMNTVELILDQNNGEPFYFRFFVSRKMGELSILTAFQMLEMEAASTTETLINFIPAIERVPSKGDPTDRAVSGRIFVRNHKDAVLPVPLLTVNAYSGGAMIASALTGATGTFLLNLPAGHYKITISLINKWFSIRSPYKQDYGWDLTEMDVTNPGQPVNLGDFIFPFGPVNSEALNIQRQISLSLGTAANFSSLYPFEKKPIPVIYPADSDYYDGRVHLSHGHHWDVNGHEIGHAVYERITKGEFGSGAHKIDECYGSTIALSEGWASYFSALTFLDPADSDAKFEFLVPRRAPIQVENIPDDVCKGPTNEWRVFGFLWDLYDTHADGNDHIEYPLQLTNKAMNTKSVSSIDEFYTNLRTLAPPEDLESLKAVWKQNFQN